MLCRSYPAKLAYIGLTSLSRTDSYPPFRIGIVGNCTKRECALRVSSQESAGFCRIGHLQSRTRSAREIPVNPLLQLAVEEHRRMPVSYTHLTLPTSDLV